ncbi:regulatory-associated protein of TOR1 [Artemisia annua]|uniref:Regulatory-associated protein of TOR1 n=1 Tax=Artemisia annua TaxID=35608 RepID=A0A2U1NRN4_ARTAN|nr:regulatory-associated protein of TOR1 [Artemisia annua]
MLWLHLLTAIVDGHRKRKETCIEANMIHVCLKHLQGGSAPNDTRTKPLFLQWLCLCLGKLVSFIVSNLGTLLFRDIGEDEYDDDENVGAEISIVKSLLNVVSDGSPLVRPELAVCFRRAIGSPLVRAEFAVGGLFVWPLLQDLGDSIEAFAQTLNHSTDSSIAARKSKYMKGWEFDSIAQASKGLMSWFPGTPYEALLLEHHLNYMIHENILNNGALLDDVSLCSRNSSLNDQTEALKVQYRSIIPIILDFVYNLGTIAISGTKEFMEAIIFKSLTDKSKLEGQPKLFIYIIPDKATNTLTIVDSGVGMTKAAE